MVDASRSGEVVDLREWVHCGVCGEPLTCTSGWADAADRDKPGVVLLTDGRWRCPKCGEPQRFGVLRPILFTTSVEVPDGSG